MNSRRSADPQLSGSTYAVMKGGSRFAMCDDYPLEPLAKLLGLRLGAVLNAPGERPFALGRRLDA